MDHKVSKDMISSGMTPSGEKTQADLGRTQYGSAPSPSKLMDAYKSMYDKKEEVINEHHKKDADGNTIPHEDEEVNEGKMPAGLQAYLDKKKGKKEDKKEVKEDFDLFDILSGKLIEEGYSEKESYEIMANLTDEQLEEINEAIVSGTLATLGVLGKLLAGGAAKAATFGKGLAAAGKLGMGVAKSSTLAAKSAKTASAISGTVGKSAQLAKPLTKVQSIAKAPIPKAPSIPKTPPAAKTYTPTQSKVTTSGGKTAPNTGLRKKDEPKNKILTTDNLLKVQMASTMLPSGQTKKQTAGTVSASADLFDIVKGQLLDEGLSEEEIRDIMLTLTPEEIMNEMAVNPKIAAMDAKNKADMIARAKAKEVPQNIRDASRRQMKAGTAAEDPKNPYTTQDKKDIINYNKNK